MHDNDIYKVRPQPFWKYKIYGDLAMPCGALYDMENPLDVKIYKFQKHLGRFFTLFQVLLVVFFFWYSAVWLTEELLLVLSFTLLYVKGYEQLRVGFENFVYPRLVEEQVWSKLVNRTERILNKVRFHSIAAYFTSVNSSSYARANLQRNFTMVKANISALALLKQELFQSKLQQLANFDTLYCTIIVNHELEHIITEQANNTFDTLKISTGADKIHKINFVSAVVV
jgi:hypothetical protein